MNQRVLQKRRHEIDRQRSEDHKKLLGDIKASVYKSEAVFVLLRSQSMPSIHENRKAANMEREGCKDLDIVYKSSTQSKSVTKGFWRKAQNRKQQNLIFRLPAPSWFPFETPCFDIYMRKTLFEGNIKILGYRVVSHNAPIMERAKRGNIAGIKEMVRIGIASAE
jgi:hypothetical protein